MQSVLLLGVAAVWAGVIVPPLLRSRVENRPNSSVTDFRRQLSILQRAVPTRSMVSMRGMARPLAQAPQQRIGAPDRGAGMRRGAPGAGYPGQGYPGQRSGQRVQGPRPQGQRMQGQYGQGPGGQAGPAARGHHAERGHLGPGGQVRRTGHDAARRSHDAGADMDRGRHRTTQVQRSNPREQVRRRRQNILYMLATTVGITGFLAATTHSGGLVLLFAASFIGLCGYCYRLVQIRNTQVDHSYSDQNWFHLS